MKKIVMILGAAALCCMGLFTSCANDEQDVKIKNWGEMYDGGNYVCDVSDIVIEGTGIPATATFSADYGKISWDNDTSSTNYRDYSISVVNLKQKVGTTETKLGTNPYEIRKIGKEYFVVNDYYGGIDEDVKNVTVDPSFESSTFTVTITYETGEGPNGADSVSMKFTRK